MRELLNVLKVEGVLFASIITMIVAILDMELRKLRVKKDNERKARLNKRREEFEAKMKFKKRAFEEYKAHIESLNFDEQVDIKEVDEDSLTLEEGVTKLVKETHHTYRPYEVNTFDIRDTLREFTVQDVLNTFYI